MDKYPVFQYKCQMSQNRVHTSIIVLLEKKKKKKKNELFCINRNSLESKQFDYFYADIKAQANNWKTWYMCIIM